MYIYIFYMYPLCVLDSLLVVSGINRAIPWILNLKSSYPLTTLTDTHTLYTLSPPSHHVTRNVNATL